MVCIKSRIGRSSEFTQGRRAAAMPRGMPTIMLTKVEASTSASVAVVSFK
jgi:hypothetical protein